MTTELITDLIKCTLIIKFKIKPGSFLFDVISCLFQGRIFVTYDLEPDGSTKTTLAQMKIYIERGSDLKVTWDDYKLRHRTSFQQVLRDSEADYDEVRLQQSVTTYYCITTSYSLRVQLVQIDKYMYVSRL